MTANQTARTLYLVKHGAPEIDADLPSHEWSLSEHGCEQAWDTAGRLAFHDIAAVVTSEERKAHATGAMMTERFDDVPLHRMLGLHEHLRYNEPFLRSEAELEARVQRFFAQPSERVMGEETADDAHRRFSNAVRAVMERHAQGDVVVVSHGTVITLLAARANGLEPFALWKQLSFGDYLRLEWPSLRLLDALN